MARKLHTLTIPSSTRYLEDVRRFVERHAREAKLPAAAIEEIKMAVDEACANVIEHAYKGDDRNNFDVDIIVQPDRITVRIRDEGEAFDLTTYREPNLMQMVATRKTGGFGVHIMRRLMDRVEYRTRGNSNECCLVKYLEHPKPGIKGLPGNTQAAADT